MNKTVYMDKISYLRDRSDGDFGSVRHKKLDDPSVAGVARANDARAGECANRKSTPQNIAKENGIIRVRILGHDTLNVGMNDAIHRAVENLSGLHSAIKDPSPPRLLVDLTG